MNKVNNRQRKGNLLILGTAFLWSFMGIITKAVSYHAMTVTGISSIMALFVLLICNRKHTWRITSLALWTGVVTAVAHICFMVANKHTTVTNAIVLQYSSPIFVVLYYRIFQKRKLKRQQLLAVGVCFIALILFFAGELTFRNMFGNAMAMLSGICFAGEFYLCAKPENDAVLAHVFSHVICIAVCLGYTGVFVRQEYDWKQTGLVLMSGFLCIGIAAVAYTVGIQMTTALNANLIAMSEVVMAPLWAFLLFEERAGSWPAAVLMIGAIVYEIWFEAKEAEQTVKKKERSVLEERQAVEVR